LVDRLHALLRENSAQVVKMEAFGLLSARAEIAERLQRGAEGLPWPITWVEGRPFANGAVAGVHIWALSGVEIEPVQLGGKLVGRAFNTGLARHCLLGDIAPADLSKDRAGQAREVFERVEAGLAQAGMKVTDLVRTWLFLDDILAWYGPFNTVRREYFAERNLFAHLLPASTGVGAKNWHGAAILGAAWGVQDVSGNVFIRQVPSPLQCPAPSYGSCFSRAVEITAPNSHRIMISGTASIAPDGSSMHDGDARAQIRLTMNVVEAILQSCDLNFSDVWRANVYFKRLEDVPLFDEWCAQAGVVVPSVIAQAEVCRDELLFEIEVDAMAVHRVRAPGVPASKTRGG
jgi:enamine deaminase RidA (YjgF/YER057c/UK114 family)